MVRLIMLLYFFIAFKPVLAQQWMGLNEEELLMPTTVGIHTSIDDGDNTTHSLTLFTALSDSVLLDANITNNQLNDESTSFSRSLYFAQLSVLTSDTIEVSMAYQYEGKKQTLETEQHQIALNYSPFPWTVAIQYLKGSAEIFTRDDLSFPIQLPDKIETDYTATSIEFSWWFDDVTLAFKHKQHDYERNVSLLSSSARLQLLVKPEALLNSGILLKQQQTISILVPLDDDQLTLSFDRLTSAIDNKSNDVLGFDYSKSINNKIRWLTAFSQTLGDSDTWSLAIGLEWSF